MVNKKKIIVGCDHFGRKLLDELNLELKEFGYAYVDVGTSQDVPVDYPDVAEKVALAITKGEYDRGVLICGTGIGMAIAANKIPGVRAACCHDVYSAERARKSNNAQIITMGARVIGSELAKSLLKIWLNSEFERGRSAPKVAKIEDLDRRYRREINK